MAIIYHPNTAIIFINEQTIADGQSLPAEVSTMLKKPMHADHMPSATANALGLT